MNNRFLPLIQASFCDNWELMAVSDNDKQTYLYKDFAKKIAEIHALFKVLNLEKGDRVALCGRNSANWAVTLFASLTYGVSITTILSDFSAETVQHIITHSESKILFAGKAVLANLDESKIPGIESIILVEDFSLIKAKSESLKIRYEEEKRLFAQKYENNFSFSDVYFHTEDPDEMAILNYTSGTTSNPKGVMIPYRSLWSNTRSAIDEVPYIKRGEKIVSNLPMGHMYGLAFELLFGISSGCHVHFLSRIPSPQYVLSTFKEYKPPVVFLVPLILEKIVKNMIMPALKGEMPQTQEVKDAVRNNLINIFGGNLKQACIAGAALSKDTGRLLTEVGFPYTVGYGMTECATLITFSDYKEFKETSCGSVVDRMEVRIESEDPENISGELYTRGMNVMLGYYKNTEATEAVLSGDGWLKTGDLATMDAEGNFYLKGRSKTMILGASGHNIYPEEIEELLNNLPHITESLVVAKDNKLVALVYPDMDFINLNDIKERISHFMDEVKEAINNRLPNYSRLSEIKLRFEEFEKTPKRSIKRFLYQ